MQIRENWAHVVGRVERWTPPAGADDHGELVVRIERVKDVKGFPNLLQQEEGAMLQVRVPSSGARALEACSGVTVSLDVRRVKDPAVVYANPETIEVRGTR
jgi:hypothetical protein